MNKTHTQICTGKGDEDSEPNSKIAKLDCSLSTLSSNLDCQIADEPCSKTKSNSLNNLLNKCFLNDGLMSKLHKDFVSGTDHVNDSFGITLSCVPYRHCLIPDFIIDKEYIQALQSVLLDLPMKRKNNDLYTFLQSVELNDSPDPTIATFRSLCMSVKQFVSEVTGIVLNDKIDLFCSQYKYKDVLLCHDDELEARRVAFIYYLVPETWQKSDGGTLDLFSTDEFGQPGAIIKSIVPVRNNFLFFEVSEKSFHQVSEVLSKTETRLSISGWFHGAPLPRPLPYVEVLEPALPFGNIDEEIFYSWFNPLYLDPEVQADIRNKFEEDSEIELQDFIQKGKYKSLEAALKDHKVNWSTLGPANKRHYFGADKSSLPPIVSEFLQVMQSDATFLVMSSLTGLKLHPLAPTDSDETEPSSSTSSSNTTSEASNPRCKSEVRRWQHGCYTLAHDTDPDMTDFALDTILYIGCEKDWDSDCGGYTSYIAKGEDEELLSVFPSGNSLALVYRDKNTVKFVKHLNHKITETSPACFYEINTVYYE
uniref:Prolyl 4-hydroxylase alpha subunit domain-containing protein n=1 Tax=Biomphalaria glabrata TaxID=6526 RepID=A0A2C9M899_BIOGL